jgi:hypothetical protein
MRVPLLWILLLSLLSATQSFNIPVNGFLNKIDGRQCTGKCSLAAPSASGTGEAAVGSLGTGSHRQVIKVPFGRTFASSVACHAMSELRTQDMQLYSLPAVGYVTEGEVVDLGGAPGRPVAYVKVCKWIFLQRECFPSM